MRILLGISFLLICFGGCNNEKVIKRATINSISIHYVDINIESIISIRCTDFESSFQDFKSLTINNKGQIIEFVKLLNNLKVEGNEYKNEPDTRIKILLSYDNDSTEVICCDRFHVMKENKY